MTPEQLAAVLVDPHPTLWIEAHSEQALLERLAVVGPLPQADLFEPWEEGDPWRARVRVPNPDPARCLAVGELEHGEAPGTTEWSDCGRIGAQTLAAGDHVASCRFDHEGDVLRPELLAVPEDTSALAERFAANVGGQTHVWVETVLHRSTGRPGYRFTAEIPGDAPAEERQAVLEAVLACGEPLATELVWWEELSRMVIVGWRVLPPVPVLPDDAGFGWSSPLEGWQGSVELQVRFAPAEHDTAAVQLAEQLGPLGFTGARPRWIGPDFVACWEGDSPVDLTLPHRRVPGCPAGLEDRWLGVDPTWWPGHLVRYHCGLEDRDLLPQHTERPADAVDHELIALLGQLGMADPVQADVPALRVVLPMLSRRAWPAWVQHFASLEHPALAPVHYVAMGEQITVLVRRREELSAVPWGRVGP